jgi:hypothetical protein
MLTPSEEHRELARTLWDQVEGWGASHKVAVVRKVRIATGLGLYHAARLYNEVKIEKALAYPGVGEAGQRLLSKLLAHGSKTEKLLELGADDYKPVYRGVALLMAPGPLRKEILGEDRMPLEPEVCRILIAAHPFFADALVTRWHESSFEDTYDFIRKAWED